MILFSIYADNLSGWFRSKTFFGKFGSGWTVSCPRDKKNLRNWHETVQWTETGKACIYPTMNFKSGSLRSFECTVEPYMRKWMEDMKHEGRKTCHDREVGWKVSTTCSIIRNLVSDNLVMAITKKNIFLPSGSCTPFRITCVWWFFKAPWNP